MRCRRRRRQLGWPALFLRPRRAPVLLPASSPPPPWYVRAAGVRPAGLRASGKTLLGNNRAEGSPRERRPRQPRVGSGGARAGGPWRARRGWQAVQTGAGAPCPRAPRAPPPRRPVPPCCTGLHNRRTGARRRRPAGRGLPGRPWPWPCGASGAGCAAGELLATPLLAFVCLLALGRCDIGGLDVLTVFPPVSRAWRVAGALFHGLQVNFTVDQIHAQMQKRANIRNMSVIGMLFCTAGRSKRRIRNEASEAASISMKCYLLQFLLCFILCY